jgi:hypothetical protein
MMADHLKRYIFITDNRPENGIDFPSAGGKIGKIGTHPIFLGENRGVLLEFRGKAAVD